ncbi:cation transporter [Polymorphobacter arshaanensis]|uniref:Cation transporter n=1 Tax=Glacieibacterium arshaanense TaxID=2511025 RepID=A0A4Y9EKH0_9SPHN|nr:cation diffusion facilitator family transporter [Polymorphobacter arshaanensis]TFU01302.1 cation transporter [Polymorphobacter arshaanensis]
MNGHHHDHGHSHGHSHAPARFDRAFAVGIALNLGYVAVEAGYGLKIGSLALVADAGHNLSDVLGLVMAWGATALARRRPSPRFTYGLRSSSILAALFNAVLLLVAVGAIIVESVRRLMDPSPVAADVVIAVAAAGILVNALTAWMFASGSKGDLNIRGAYLHMAADAAVSLGVVVAAVVMMFTGWAWLDPVVSLVISAVIVAGTWGLLRDSTSMALHAVPPGLDLRAVEAQLLARPGVVRVHDLHVWSMSTTETALTAHLQIPAGHPGDAFLCDTAEALEHQFGIGHMTLQIETDGSDCAQAPADAV